jgi:GWxTD domain-containing protein
LTIDSSFTINTNETIQFQKEGLYNIFADTTQSEGLGLLVVNERFPKLTKPELLLEPLVYMSTNTEIGEIKKAQEFKKALDKYWLTLMNGNAPLAQQSIKSFYSRVEEANQLFTTYKEGWKTDKGMIFIVLGPPDKVQRSKDREVWTYDQRANAQNVNFTFNRRTNQFVDDHYELVRYAEYQPIWYPIVEAWRNGTIR